jgi:hypothetical protein
MRIFQFCNHFAEAQQALSGLNVMVLNQAVV